MTNFTFYWVLFFLSARSSGVIAGTNIIQGPGDIRFQDYLKTSFQNYHVWLQENNYDPTEPITKSMFMESYIQSQMYLTCELKNQQIIGHSSNSNQSYHVESYFEDYTFEVLRQYYQPIQFQGEFKCDGLLNSPVTEKIWFHGSGKYKLETNTSAEFAGYTNVGITEDYLVNLTISRFTYSLLLTFKPGVFSVYSWNDTRINTTYLADVENEFESTFSRYMHHPYDWGIPDLHPSLPLIKTYLLNLTQNLDLKTMISEEEDLPTPYIPTAIPPSTTPIVTSSTSERVQTSLVTTTDLSSTTTEDSSGSNMLIINTLVMTIYVLLLQVL